MDHLSAILRAARSAGLQPSLAPAVAQKVRDASPLERDHVCSETLSRSKPLLSKNVYRFRVSCPKRSCDRVNPTAITGNDTARQRRTRRPSLTRPRRRTASVYPALGNVLDRQQRRWCETLSRFVARVHLLKCLVIFDGTG
jgi:hypothetical protein